MGRPPKPDAERASSLLALRLTPADRAELDALVAARTTELAAEGLEVTATSYIRGLIRREGAAKRNARGGGGTSLERPAPLPDRHLEEGAIEMPPTPAETSPDATPARGAAEALEEGTSNDLPAPPSVVSPDKAPARAASAPQPARKRAKLVTDVPKTSAIERTVPLPLDRPSKPARLPGVPSPSAARAALGEYTRRTGASLREIAVTAGIPSATLSKFRRDKAELSADRLDALWRVVGVKADA